jgi:hypothetical protein
MSAAFILLSLTSNLLVKRLLRTSTVGLQICRPAFRRGTKVSFQLEEVPKRFTEFYWTFL